MRLLTSKRSFLVILVIAVLAEFCGRGLCNINNDCPNGVRNITGLKSGSIKSPNFPDSYSFNETVCWRITVPKGYFALLVIHSFDVELCENCQCDYLEVSDVSFSSGVGRQCGRYTANYLAYQYDLDKPPLVSLATGDTGYIRFVSDDTEHRSGFNATFLAASPDSGVYSFLNATEDETITFTSPDYGKRKYPYSYMYQWFLIVPEGRQVSISFDEFDLESSTDCENDWVELREAVIVKLEPNVLSGQFGAFVGDRFCNSNKPGERDYQSSGNLMWVQFKTDFNSTTRYKGFKASFKAVGGVGKLSLTSPLLPFLAVALSLFAESKFGGKSC